MQRLVFKLKQLCTVCLEFKFHRVPWILPGSFAFHGSQVDCVCVCVGALLQAAISPPDVVLIC